jgi:hypothetical protein
MQAFKLQIGLLVKLHSLAKFKRSFLVEKLLSNGIEKVAWNTEVIGSCTTEKVDAMGAKEFKGATSTTNRIVSVGKN